MTWRVVPAALMAALIAAPVPVSAHDGPPFPILSDHVSGPYLISIWTDPDTTDDGSAGGQFWVRVHRAGTRDDVAAETRATVTIRPLDRPGPERSAPATPVRNDISNQFAAVVMDHEGRFAVAVTIAGPLGAGSASAAVEATYDLRPARPLLFLYLAPFVLVGLLWGRVLLKRRNQGSGTSTTSSDCGFRTVDCGLIADSRLGTLDLLVIDCTSSRKSPMSLQSTIDKWVNQSPICSPAIHT